MNTNKQSEEALTTSPLATDGLEPLLSMETLAEYVGVPVVTIYRWRTEGKGPCAVRIGRHLKFALADVQPGPLEGRELCDSEVAALPLDMLIGSLCRHPQPMAWHD
ncbi:AlpA family transcriptional regulator [Cellulomonas sp. URHE0023]|uniref:helix-turn-helix transcriptional regulator n=1 Tax=Cellulomonas sp. URHE0023 TaxID=1380354 RepID=UPI0009DE81F6|nr:helix-turn-helix domain-containing protein [Cellulomonas sp. URHE0023]